MRRKTLIDLTGDDDPDPGLVLDRFRWLWRHAGAASSPRRQVPGLPGAWAAFVDALRAVRAVAAGHAVDRRRLWYWLVAHRLDLPDGECLPLDGRPGCAVPGVTALDQRRSRALTLWLENRPGLPPSLVALLEGQGLPRGLPPVGATADPAAAQALAQVGLHVDPVTRRVALPGVVPPTTPTLAQEAPDRWRLTQSTPSQ